MIGIFQGSPEGRANECQRRAKGGLPRATSKKQGKRRAWQGSLAAMPPPPLKVDFENKCVSLGLSGH